MFFLPNHSRESLAYDNGWGGCQAVCTQVHPVYSFVKIVIIVMFSWKWIGWNMVIYLAGMQGINNDIYEAATIDGANHRQVFLKITLPLLKPIVLFTIIQSTIGTMNLFVEPFVLTGNLRGGTGNQGMTVMISYFFFSASFYVR